MFLLLKMPRQNMNFDGKIVGSRKSTKVRKRACSSSSSSSLVGNYRLKRAILVGRRSGGSGTPVPMWKITRSRSPSLKNHKFLAANCGERAKELPNSARKLGAMLREIGGFSSDTGERQNIEKKISELERIKKKGILSDPLCGPDYERMDPSKMSSHTHRRKASAGSQKLTLSDCSFSNLLEIDRTHSHGHTPCRGVIGVKNRLKDVHNGLTTSKQLLKVFSRIWRLQEQQSTSLSLISSLKFELDRACIQVNKLIDEQRVNHGEIDILLKLFEQEKTVWKVKERDRIHSAITTIASELEIERKLRQQTERLNKKLGRELAETKSSLTCAVEKLESEKRARKMLEEVCDELGRGIGEDKAKVNELKKQTSKVCEEVEKEREMLQLADVLREERMQMKLTEAKYEFEERNAVVDELTNEIESYLKSKTIKEVDDSPPSSEKLKQLEKYLRETLPGSCQYRDKEKENIKQILEENPGEEDDFADNDLHSIELNVNDINKSYEWSNAIKNESRNSADKIKGRKSIPEKIRKPNVSVETRLSDGIEWQFTSARENSDMFSKKGLLEFSSPWKNETKDEIERYDMIKELKDHIISSNRIASSQNLTGPGI